MQPTDYIWHRVTPGEQYGPAGWPLLLLLGNAVPHVWRLPTRPAAVDPRGNPGGPARTDPELELDVTHWADLWPGWNQDIEWLLPESWRWASEDLLDDVPRWYGRSVLPPPETPVVALIDRDALSTGWLLSTSDEHVQAWRDMVLRWCRLPALPVVLEQSGPMHD